MSGAGCPARKFFFFVVAIVGNRGRPEARILIHPDLTIIIVPEKDTHTKRQELTQEQHHSNMGMYIYIFSKLRELSVNGYWVQERQRSFFGTIH